MARYFGRHLSTRITRAGCIARVRVDLDPVIAHLRLSFVTLRVENNQIRILPGHVAINAVAAGFVIPLWKGFRSRLVAA
jgi:hypothetical protein